MDYKSDKCQKIFHKIKSNKYTEEDIKKATNDNFAIQDYDFIINCNLLQYACLQKNLDLVKMFDLNMFKETKDLLLLVRMKELGQDIYDYLSSNNFVDKYEHMEEFPNYVNIEEVNYKKIVYECESDLSNAVVNDKCLNLKLSDLNKMIPRDNGWTTYIRQIVIQKKPYEMLEKILQNGADPFINHHTHIFEHCNNEQFKIIFKFAIKNKIFIDEKIIKKTKYGFFFDLISDLESEKYFIV